MTDPNESNAIQLARIDERMKMLMDKMEENHESHLRTRAWMGQVDRTLNDISTRVSSVESSIAKNAPSLEELIAIKHKVVGAGMAGRWLWIGLGALLTFILTTSGLRQHLGRLLTGQGW